jgi:hypothetical protein
MVKWLQRRRDGRMAPFLKRTILIALITAGVALAAYVAVGFGNLFVK